jgi:hypothetical protein
VDCSLTGKTWKPVDIARYHWEERHLNEDGVDEVLELLKLPEETKQAPEKKMVEEEAEREEEKEEEQESKVEETTGTNGQKEEKPSLPRLMRHSNSCDYCCSVRFAPCSAGCPGLPPTADTL